MLRYTLALRACRLRGSNHACRVGAMTAMSLRRVAHGEVFKKRNLAGVFAIEF
jgi:hypothetical protein